MFLCVAGFDEILGDVSKSTHETGHRLIKRNAQGLRIQQSQWIVPISAEVVQVVLNLPGQRHRLAEIEERLSGSIELLPAFREPVLQLDVVGTPAALIDIELIGTVDRNGFLNVFIELLKIHDVAIDLVIAVEAVGAADGLKKVVIMQLVVQINVGAARSIKSREQLAHYNQQLEIGWLFDEAALDLIFVSLSGLAVLENMLGISIKLIAFIAVGRLAGDGVMVRLKRRDHTAILAKWLGLKDAEVVASVVDARGHEDGGAPVVVEARLGVEIMDDARGDSCLALFGAHQLLHRGPALADDGLLEVVQRLCFLLKKSFDILRRREPLGHVSRFIPQVEHHPVGYGLMKLVGVDIGSEKVLRAQTGRIPLEKWRAGEANEQGIHQPSLHLPVHVATLAAMALIHEHIETATDRWRRALQVCGIELMQQGAENSGSGGAELGHQLIPPSDTGGW